MSSEHLGTGISRRAARFVTVVPTVILFALAGCSDGNDSADPDPTGTSLEPTTTETRPTTSTTEDPALSANFASCTTGVDLTGSTIDVLVRMAAACATTDDFVGTLELLSDDAFPPPLTGTLVARVTCARPDLTDASGCDGFPDADPAAGLEASEFAACLKLTNVVYGMVVQADLDFQTMSDEVASALSEPPTSQPLREAASGLEGASVASPAWAEAADVVIAACVDGGFVNPP